MKIERDKYSTVVSNDKETMSRLLGIGFKADLSFSERLRLELSNLLALIGIPMLILFMFLNFISLNSLIEHLISIVWILLLSAILFFNSIYQYAVARHIIAFCGINFTALLHVLYGPNMSTPCLYIMFIMIVIYFFPFRIACRYIIYALSLFALATLFVYSYPDLALTEYNDAGPYGYFVFCLIIVVSLTVKVLIENKVYQKRILQKSHLLRERNEQLERFNFILSHDLKEPIRSIVSFSDLLKKETKDNLEKKSMEYLAFISTSGRQLDKLIDDINTFHGIEELKLNNQTVKMKGLVKELEKEISKETRNKNILINCSDLPVFCSSIIALKIILKQLIWNGIKYNDKKTPTISIVGAIEEEATIIEVSDNGIGIDKAYFANVFTMFKRLHSDFPKGSGLGLNIAHKMVDKMNGKIELIKSEKGVGSTFRILLPNISA